MGTTNFAGKFRRVIRIRDCIQRNCNQRKLRRVGSNCFCRAFPFPPGNSTGHYCVRLTTSFRSRGLYQHQGLNSTRTSGFSPKLFVNLIKRVDHRRLKGRDLTTFKALSARECLRNTALPLFRYMSQASNPRRKLCFANRASRRGIKKTSQSRSLFVPYAGVCR